MPDDTSRSQVAVLTTAEYKTYAVVSEALLRLEASVVAGNVPWTFAAWLQVRPALKTLLQLLFVVGVFIVAASAVGQDAA